MQKTSVLLLIFAMTIIGAGCGKNATNDNLNAVTNSSTVTNTTTNTNTTTGTFETNTNAGSDTNTSLINSNKTAPTANPAQTATLTITSSGISPTTLTIASGTKVTIVNNDSRSHQIASDPHPSHTDLPAFDNTIAAGSSVTFTFTQVGSWSYHDHDDAFDPRWKGSVIVR